MMARSRVLLFALAVGLVVAASPATATEHEDQVPAFSLVVDKVEFRTADETAVATVLVRNVGVGSETGRVRLFAENGRPVDGATPTSFRSPKADVTTVDISFPLEGNNDVRSGQLVFDDRATIDEPAIVPFEVSTSADTTALWWAVLGSLGVAILLVGARYLSLNEPGEGADKRYPLGRLLREADGSWTFTDSWASTLTAAGAVLGTVLGATGYIGETFTAFSTSEFVGLSLLFGGIAFLAPLAFAVLRREEDEPSGDVVYGTYSGLLVAAALTTWAVSGELIAVAVLLMNADFSGPAQIGLAALFVVVAVLVTSYVWRSIRMLVVDVAPSTTLDLPNVLNIARRAGGQREDRGVPAQSIVVIAPARKRSAIL